MTSLHKMVFFLSRQPHEHSRDPELFPRTMFPVNTIQLAELSDVRELFACTGGMATGCCCSMLIRWLTASQVRECLFLLLENHWILSGKFNSVHTINYCVGCESRTGKPSYGSYQQDCSALFGSCNQFYQCPLSPKWPSFWWRFQGSW